MDNLLIYGPCAIFIITALIQFKIFARADELPKLKAELMTYAAEHFVSRDTYSDNHKALQDHILQIQQDISDVKTLLINFASNHNSRN